MSVIDKLNELFALDPVAVSKLLELRAPVNDAVTDHPNITVTPDLELGILGVLRHVTLIKVAAVVDKDRVVKFMDEAKP